MGRVSSANGIMLNTLRPARRALGECTPSQLSRGATASSEPQSHTPSDPARGVHHLPCGARHLSLATDAKRGMFPQRGAGVVAARVSLKGVETARGRGGGDRARERVG